MSRKKDWGTGALRSTLAIQERIRDKFGEELIADAKQRLCSKCKRQGCGWIPICTDGKDCPYFEVEESDA